MKLITKYAIIIALITALPSCASLISKNNWPVTINTNPSGARIEITDIKGKVVYYGVSPATMNLSSSVGYFEKQSYRLKISMEGYGDRIVPIECKLNGWYIGNVFFGGFGVIGMLVVDPITGAMFKLDRDFFYEILDKNPTAQAESMKVVALQDLPLKYKEHLVPVN